MGDPFAEAVLEGRALRCLPAEAAGSLQAIEAFCRSARKGGRREPVWLRAGEDRQVQFSPEYGSLDVNQNIFSRP